MPTKNNTCRRCLQTKEAKHFYCQRRNVTGLENICKDCKRIESTAKRYKVSERLIEHLYTYTACMCCEEIFKDRKLVHIHHTQKQGVRGIICLHCNHILSEETLEDEQRIQNCMKFMACNNLLDTVNPQERLTSIEATTESSETTRCETLTCKQCKRANLTLRDFHSKVRSRKPRRICKDCWNANWRLRNRSKKLRLQATYCDCCNGSFTKHNKSCVHHVGEKIQGIVCNRCNQVLGNESIQRYHQLQACLRFMI